DRRRRLDRRHRLKHRDLVLPAEPAFVHSRLPRHVRGLCSRPAVATRSGRFRRPGGSEGGVACRTLSCPPERSSTRTPPVPHARRCAGARVADGRLDVTSHLLRTGQQVGGSTGLAVLGTVARTVVANSVHTQAARTAAIAARAGHPIRPDGQQLAAAYHHALATGFARAFL